MPIVISLLVLFTPDTDSLSDPGTLLESSFSSNKSLLSPGSKLYLETGYPFSRFLIEVYILLDCFGLIKGSVHDRKFSSSIFHFPFFKDTVPHYLIHSFFWALYLLVSIYFLVSPILFPANQLKQNKKISKNKKDFRPKRISEAYLGLTAAASKMELFVAIVNGWAALNFVTKSSVFDTGAVLDPSLNTQYGLLPKTIIPSKQAKNYYKK